MKASDVRIGVTYTDPTTHETTEAILERRHRHTIEWELAAHRQGWPVDATTTGMTWVAWRILRSEGALPIGVKWEDWLGLVDEVRPCKADGTTITDADLAEEVEPDPTQPGPESA